MARAGSIRTRARGLLLDNPKVEDGRHDPEEAEAARLQELITGLWRSTVKIQYYLY
jgi:hypothetical protein